MSYLMMVALVDIDAGRPPKTAQKNTLKGLVNRGMVQLNSHSGTYEMLVDGEIVIAKMRVNYPYLFTFHMRETGS